MTSHGRYICEFPNRDEGHNNEAPVVRPDTPPTPGATGPEERPATHVTPRAPAEGVPTDGSPKPSDGRSSPATPGGGTGGEFCQSPFLSPPLTPAHEDESPPTPGRSATQIDLVTRPFYNTPSVNGLIEEVPTVS